MTRKYSIHTPDDIRNVATVIYQTPRPFQIAIREGADRSLAQNRLAWDLAGDIFNQRPEMESAQRVHAYNKLHFGVEIRKEDSDFRDKYDRIIRPLDYEDKLELMAPPIDFPITRDMSVRQMSAFIEAVYAHWSKQGVQLHIPEAA
jgi:hypothetical protein